MRYTGFLCGGFSTAEGRLRAAALLPQGWKAQTASEEQVREYGRFYLPEFIRFCLSPEAGEDKAMARFSTSVGKTISIHVGGEGKTRPVSVAIPEIQLFLFPFRMAIYAIRIEMDAEEDDITASVAAMRGLSRTDSDALAEFRHAAMEPIVSCYKALTGKEECEYSSLVEYGNKMKVFQIAVTDRESWNSQASDRLLFELGTVAPAGSYNAKSQDSFSEDYFNELMSGNTLSIYNNWKCLSLTDTLTILCFDCPDWLIKNWTKDYFGLLYICQLYRRNYLLRLTSRFRLERENVEKLERESVDFERTCYFHRISYNFLPEMFNGCIEKGLKTDEEKEVLYHMILQEEADREKKADGQMNSLLFFMTCVTMVSSIYDASCLLGEVLPYGETLGSNIVGFRLVASVLTMTVLAAILVFRIKSKKR